MIVFFLSIFFPKEGCIWVAKSDGAKLENATLKSQTDVKGWAMKNENENLKQI
jgi:hypothetical protein